MKMWIHTCLKCKHEQAQYKDFKKIECEKCGGETTTK